MAMDFLAGCVGGFAGVISGHPLDTLKVHIQTGRGTALSCTREILKKGSLTSLYRGVGPPLFGVAGINALVFGTYANTRRSLPCPDSIISHGTAGFFAGIVQSFITSPVELIKTRQQLAIGSNSMPVGTVAATQHIYRSGGLKALYRGLGVTMARDCPAFAIYFATYETLTRGSRNAAKIFAAGGVAGAISWIILYPVDVVKSRIQADTRWSGSWECARNSIQTEGWACMRRGLAAVTVRAFICNGATFTAVAWVERMYENWRTDTVRPLLQALQSHSELHAD